MAGCVDGDVRTVDTKGTPSSALDTPTTPEVYYKGEWYPICGHDFWDNNNGATTLCEQLGFTTGDLVGGYYPDRDKPERVYPKDAMLVGKCRAGEALTACTDRHTYWGNLDGRVGGCRQGNHVRISTRCSGGSTHRTSSCRTPGKLPFSKGYSPGCIGTATLRLVLPRHPRANVGMASCC